MPFNPTRSAVLALISASFALAGCRHVAKNRRYEFLVRVTSDTDRPLAGTSILRGDASLGRTDETGTARIAMQGNEGEELLLTLGCPDKFAASGAGLRVRLHHLADRKSVPEYAASCLPSERTVVIAVRSDGPDLPIVYLGRELARTDESGAAHVLLTAATNSSFELTLGTDEPAAVRLRPQNPSMRFVVPDHDDIMPFDQHFIELPEKKHAPRRRPLPQEEDPGPTPL